MDGRIVGVTEELVRKVYKLNPAYEPIQCNVKRDTVEMEMTNGLISIKVKMPRDIIEGVLQGEDVTHYLEGEPPVKDKDGFEDSEEDLEKQEEETPEEQSKKSLRKVNKYGKNKKESNK